MSDISLYQNDNKRILMISIFYIFQIKKKKKAKDFWREDKKYLLISRKGIKLFKKK